MTKKEKEILTSLILEIINSDDKIDPLETLYFEVKKMVGIEQVYEYEDLEAESRR